MKDRFRFRAWNKSLKIMLHDFEFLNTYTTLGKVAKDEEFVLMQCTGLKDKNGKLIYEGDIIKYICGGETIIGSLEIDRFNLLTFTNMITCAFCEDWTEIVKAVFFAGDAQIEIIGNIYENKELLKEQK